MAAVCTPPHSLQIIPFPLMVFFFFFGVTTILNARANQANYKSDFFFFFFRHKELSEALQSHGDILFQLFW